MGLQNLPKPPTPLRKIIEEDVNKHHSDSSDDDYNLDQKFRETSYRHTQALIDQFDDKRIMNINKQIHWNIYDKGLLDWKTHRMLPRELYNKTDLMPKITSTRNGGGLSKLGST